MEIPTKVVRYFLGMTVLFGARTSLFKFQFIEPQTDTERYPKAERLQTNPVTTCLRRLAARRRISLYFPPVLG